MLARDSAVDPRYQAYYDAYATCGENSCPDSYYDFTSTCTVQKCPIGSSHYAYLLSRAANGILLALFAASLACYLGQGVISRRFIGFTVAMVSGCILEVLGYAGRLMSNHNP